MPKNVMNVYSVSFLRILSRGVIFVPLSNICFHSENLTSKLTEKKRERERDLCCVIYFPKNIWLDLRLTFLNLAFYQFIRGASFDARLVQNKSHLNRNADKENDKSTLGSFVWPGNCTALHCTAFLNMFDQMSQSRPEMFTGTLNNDFNL